MQSCLLYFFLFLALYSGSCSRSKPDCDCSRKDEPLLTATTSAIDSIPCPQLFRLQNRYGWDRDYGVQLFRQHEQYFGGFVNYHGDSLIIVPLLDSTFHHAINVKGLFTSIPYNNLSIRDDTILLFNTDRFVLNKFSVSSDWTISLVATYSLKTLMPKNTAYNGNAEIDQKIIYKYPYLFVPYLAPNQFDYADKHAMLQINLQTHLLKKVFTYPSIYHSCIYLWIEPISIRNGNTITIAFANSDELATYDLETGKELRRSASQTSFKNSVMCYNTNMSENLAYDEKYQKFTERNFNLIAANNRYYLVKRVAGSSDKSPTLTAILVFDKDLNSIGYKILKENVTPRLSFAYNDKVAIYSYTTNSFYLYEI